VAGEPRRLFAADVKGGDPGANGAPVS